jgi:hypothetical protein
VSADGSPTARALRALEILQSRPGATAAELAGRLGVTDRAARRYVGILREAGIPVESTRGRFTPPEGLDPVARLEENLGTGWEYATRVAFDAPAAEVARWIRPPMGRLEPLGDGCVLVGSTSNPAMYAQEWLAGVPLAFRVEGGPELRAAVQTLARRLAAALTDGS